MVKRYGLNTIIFNLMVCTQGKSEVGLIPPSTEQIRGWGFHSKGWTMEIGHFYQSLKEDLWTISSVVELMDGRQFGADQMVSIVASLL